MRCRTCKEPFEPARADAKFCSNKCRQSAHRAKQTWAGAKRRLRRVQEEIGARSVVRRTARAHSRMAYPTSGLTKPDRGQGPAHGDGAHLPVERIQFKTLERFRFKTRTCAALEFQTRTLSSHAVHGLDLHGDTHRLVRVENARCACTPRPRLLWRQT